MNKRIELLSPAGDLERLKYAIDFGADAVYVGGKKLSLRSAASNFTLDDIEEGAKYAHMHNAKLYVTCNIVMHEVDTTEVLDYLKELDKRNVDAIIASSPTIIKLTKKYTHMEAHVSTQQSISNSKGIEFISTVGADRVVLARECSLENIKDICHHSPLDIEVFIEGAMCASVSGRCMLSNVMTNRDANRGGCAQSCRWNYDIYQDKEKVSIGYTDFAMSSKDLNGIRIVPELIEAGVASLKIEGRMKSLHYIATIVNAYRHAIDEYYLNHKVNDFESLEKSLAKGENREVSHGFFLGEVTHNQIIYNHNLGSASHDFLGIVKDYDEKTNVATIEVRNLFKGNRSFEILSPLKSPFNIDVKEIYDEEMNLLEVANHPQSLIKFITNIKLKPNDLIR